MERREAARAVGLGIGSQGSITHGHERALRHVSRYS
jgi:hypothetical protein